MIFAHYVDEGPIDYAGDDPRVTAFWTKLFAFESVEEFRIIRQGIETGNWQRKNARILHVFDTSGKFGSEVMPIGVLYATEQGGAKL